MLVRPVYARLPPALQDRGRQALEALRGLNMREQLEVAARHVVRLVKAGRPHFEAETEKREAVDAVCDGVEE
jgi:hypothetical protein